MAYNTAKTLAQGQAHLTASAVYTGTDTKKTEVALIWLHNSSAILQAAKIYVGTTSASANLMFNESLSASTTYEISPKFPFVLQGTSSIWLQSTNSSSLNYMVVGREEA